MGVHDWCEGPPLPRGIRVQKHYEGSHSRLSEQFGRHCLPNLRIDGVEEAEAASFAGIYPLQPRVYQQLGGNLIHAG